MYLRFSSIIELSASIIKIKSRQALADRLGIGISTLNAYRSGTRFPKSAQTPHLRKCVQDLLYEAIILTKDKDIKNFDFEFYIINCLRVEEHFQRLTKTFYLGDIGNIASQISFLLFTEADAKKINYSSSDVKSVLALLLRQQPSIFSLSVICKWIFETYIKYVYSDNYSQTTPRVPYSVPVTSIPNFKKTYQENNSLSIPMPHAWDIILTCNSKTILETSFMDASLEIKSVMPELIIQLFNGSRIKEGNNYSGGHGISQI